MSERDEGPDNGGLFGSLKGGFRQFGAMGHVGIMFPVSIAFGMGIGYWLDGRFGTAPWLMLGGFVVGVGTALRELLRAAAKLDRESPDDDGPTWTAPD